MFPNQIMDAKPTESNCEKEYDSSKGETQQDFVVNVTSPCDTNYFLKRQYASPVLLSKSVPGRSKSFFRYRINRSLNFDIGNVKNNNLFKSPNSSSDSSSFESDKQLTRSAKIMRALNFNHSPLYSQRRKIKKTLNFNLSPSPKKFSPIKSPRNTRNLFLSTSSPIINKTLNFDTSPSDSSTSSILLTSPDSTDENQNQTPSQQCRKAKNVLRYITPNVKATSSERYIVSPLLRSNLKEKIDSIVQSSDSFNRSKQKLSNLASLCAPRNLFSDFHDESDRPHTPENTVHIIPESMSDIKKSHKKERSSRHMDKFDVDKSEILTEKVNTSTNKKLDLLQEDKESSSFLMKKEHMNFNYDTTIDSIEQFHEVDKSKECSFEDKCSNAGSIFDYEIEQRNNENENISQIEQSIGIDKMESNVMSEKEDDHCEIQDSMNISKNANNFSEESMDEKTKEHELNKSASSSNIQTSWKKEDSSVDFQNNLPTVCVTDANLQNEQGTPQANEINSEHSQRAATPENHINFLQYIETESIKKSHKKMKDANKKKLLLSKNIYYKAKEEKLEIIDCNTEKEIPDNNSDCNLSIKNTSSDNKNNDRACTPENVNSSRLLLSQFSSIKKSHKKDKHNKIVSESIRRQKYLRRDVSIDVQQELENQEDFSNDESKNVTSRNDLSINASINDLKEQDDNQFLSTFSEYNNRISSLCNEKVISHSKLPLSKRKIYPDLSRDNLKIQYNSQTELNEPENTETFKIFTPIKKRKPLMKSYSKKDSVSNISSEKDDSLEEDVIDTDIYRGQTPILRCYDDSTSTDNECMMLEKDNDTHTRILDNENCNSDTNSQSHSEENGRSTPKNMSTAELLSNLNSIKKSHKKDKRGNGVQRSLILEQENFYTNMNENELLENNCQISTVHSTLNINNLSSKNNNNSINSDSTHNFSDINYDNPQPSTSQNNTDIENTNNMQNNDIKLLNKTPPNCLQVKNYIRLLQATSIKKSHKKVRDKKKNNKIIVNDLDVSDDGSIFGEEDKMDSLARCTIIQDNSDGNSIDNFHFTDFK